MVQELQHLLSEEKRAGSVVAARASALALEDTGGLWQAEHQVRALQHELDSARQEAARGERQLREQGHAGADHRAGRSQDISRSRVASSWGRHRLIRRRPARRGKWRGVHTAHCALNTVHCTLSVLWCTTLDSPWPGGDPAGPGGRGAEEEGDEFLQPSDKAA